MTHNEDQLIMESAKLVVPFIASLDPLWSDEIEVMRKERGWDDLQILGALCGYTLEQQAHMWIPQHPFFSDNHIPAGARQVCVVCDKEWIVAYPGQPVCSNACAEAYYAKKSNPTLTAMENGDAKEIPHKSARGRKAISSDSGASSFLSSPDGKTVA